MRNRIPRIHIKGGGVAINPHKTLTIESWTTPESKKGVQSFLGLVNFYGGSLRIVQKYPSH